MTDINKTNPVDLICDNIYVGGVDSLFSGFIEKNNIKAIVSMVESKLPKDFTPERLLFNILDLDSTIIIIYFCKTNEFIEKYVNSNETILVHCFYGQSRSVTIVAAYLMYSKHLGAYQAIEYIRARHHEIFVNDGFQRQLLVYEWILSKKTIGFEIYHLFLVQNIQNQKETSDYDPSIIENCDMCNKYENKCKISSNYKCKKCGFILFTNENLIAKVNNFYYIVPHFRISNYFVEKTNKIDCPKCNKHVGRFKKDEYILVDSVKIEPQFMINSNDVDIISIKKINKNKQ